MVQTTTDALGNLHSGATGEFTKKDNARPAGLGVPSVLQPSRIYANVLVGGLGTVQIRGSEDGMRAAAFRYRDEDDSGANWEPLPVRFDTDPAACRTEDDYAQALRTEFAAHEDRLVARRQKRITDEAVATTSTAEAWAGKRAPNYSTLPRLDVPVLALPRSCATCGEPVELGAAASTYGIRPWVHVGAVADHYVTPKLVCKYCGSDDEFEVVARQHAYSDTTECSRCGGVEGYGIGD